MEVESCGIRGSRGTSTRQPSSVPLVDVSQPSQLISDRLSLVRCTPAAGERARCIGTAVGSISHPPPQAATNTSDLPVDSPAWRVQGVQMYLPEPHERLPVSQTARDGVHKTGFSRGSQNKDWPSCTPAYAALQNGPIATRSPPDLEIVHPACKTPNAGASAYRWPLE